MPGIGKTCAFRLSCLGWNMTVRPPGSPREPRVRFGSAGHQDLAMGTQDDRPRASGDAGGHDGVESPIRLLYSRNGQRSPAALSTNVILASSNQRGWRSPLVFEVHRMSNHEYGEHRTLGHQLMINLGGSVRLGWLEDGRRRESEFRNEQMCIQSDGDSNAPRGR